MSTRVGIAARFELLREFTRKITLENCVHRSIDVVGDAHKLSLDISEAGREEYVSGAPVTILWSSNTSCIDEVNSANYTVPRFVGVAKANDVPRM